MQKLKNNVHQIDSRILCQLPFQAIELLACPEAKPCIFIKLITGKFAFGNENFCRVFGQSKLLGKRDEDLTSNKDLVASYKEQDILVMSTERYSFKTEYLEPKAHKNYQKQFNVSKFPLYLGSDRPNAVFGIALPLNKLLSLDSENILRLNSGEISQLLTQNKYEVSANQAKYSFTKREIICFIELFKGKHAGEIALALNLKQATVESYIGDLRSKCGVSHKSSLIAFFIDNNILKQIFV